MAVGYGKSNLVQVTNTTGAELAVGDLVLLDPTTTPDKFGFDVDDTDDIVTNSVPVAGVVVGNPIPDGDIGSLCIGGVCQATVLGDAGDAHDAGDFLEIDVTAGVNRLRKAGGNALAADNVVAATAADLQGYLTLVRAIALEDGAAAAAEETLEVMIINNPVAVL